MISVKASSWSNHLRFVELMKSKYLTAQLKYKQGDLSNSSQIFKHSLDISLRYFTWLKSRAPKMLSSENRLLIRVAKRYIRKSLIHYLYVDLSQNKDFELNKIEIYLKRKFNQDNYFSSFISLFKHQDQQKIINDVKSKFLKDKKAMKLKENDISFSFPIIDKAAVDERSKPILLKATKDFDYNWSALPLSQALKLKEAYEQLAAIYHRDDQPKSAYLCYKNSFMCDIHTQKSWSAFRNHLSHLETWLNKNNVNRKQAVLEYIVAKNDLLKARLNITSNFKEQLMIANEILDGLEKIESPQKEDYLVLQQWLEFAHQITGLPTKRLKSFATQSLKQKIDKLKAFQFSKANKDWSLSIAKAWQLTHITRDFMANLVDKIPKKVNQPDLDYILKFYHKKWIDKTTTLSLFNAYIKDTVNSY